MLRRLWCYCDKIFKLTDHLAQLKNHGFTKKNNEPFITAILLVAMIMRSRSFKEKVLKTSHWRWLTNMPPIYSSKIVHRFGHGRWNEEERGFNDLATNCH